jgi:hypothetical protein
MHGSAIRMHGTGASGACMERELTSRMELVLTTRMAPALCRYYFGEANYATATMFFQKARKHFESDLVRTPRSRKRAASKAKTVVYCGTEPSHRCVCLSLYHVCPSLYHGCPSLYHVCSSLYHILTPRGSILIPRTSVHLFT